jgi:hypothetical protein
MIVCKMAILDMLTFKRPYKSQGSGMYSVSSRQHILLTQRSAQLLVIYCKVTPLGSKGLPKPLTDYDYDYEQSIRVCDR